MTSLLWMKEKHWETPTYVKIITYRNITNIKRPKHCKKEKYIENQRETPIYARYAGTTDWVKKIFVVGDSH